VLLLTLLVAALAAFIWFFEREVPSTDERRELESRLLPIEVEEVTSVFVERDGMGTRLERIEGEGTDENANGEWRLAEPLVSRADGEEVRSLLSSLTGLEKKRELSGIAPSEVGLETPRLRLTIATAEDEWTLSVGSEVPATDDVVVSVEGRGAFVTAGRFVEDLEREPGEWRARDVIAAHADEIREIRILGSRDDLVLVREDDHFVLEEPVRDAADEEAVGELLTALTGLEVEQFLDGELIGPDLGLDPPSYEMAVTFEGREEPLVVRLGALEPGGELRFGEAEGQRFTVETDLPSILDRPYELFQSRDWTEIESFEIDAVQLTLEDVETGLVRADGEWRRDGEIVPYSVARGLLDAITGLRAESVMPTDDGGVEADASSLSLVIEAGDRTEILRLWPSANAVSLAAREGRNYMLKVSSEKAEGVMAAVKTLREAVPEVEIDSEVVSAE
jgi:hypothetical protein